MPADLLYDFRDEIQTLLESIGYTVFQRETFKDGDVNRLRLELKNENITTVDYAYLTEQPSNENTSDIGKVGYYARQQDVLISTIYEYDFLDLKTNAPAKMAAIQELIDKNVQLGGKADRMTIIDAQKGYTGDALTMNPANTVVGGLIIQLRIFL